MARSTAKKRVAKRKVGTVVPSLRRNKNTRRAKPKTFTRGMDAGKTGRRLSAIPTNGAAINTQIRNVVARSTAKKRVATKRKLVTVVTSSRGAAKPKIAPARRDKSTRAKPKTLTRGMDAEKTKRKPLAVASGLARSRRTLYRTKQ